MIFFCLSNFWLNFLFILRPALFGLKAWLYKIFFSSLSPFCIFKCSVRVRKNFFLSQKIIFVSEIIFCHIIIVLLQKLLPVTKTSFCHRNFFLSEKHFSVTETYFSHRNFFMSPKLLFVTHTSVTKTSLCHRNCDNNLFLTKYAWIQMNSFREKWEFPLSQIIEIITLWSPGGVSRGTFVFISGLCAG